MRSGGLKRRCVAPLLAVLVALLGLAAPGAALGAAPTVTLATPANGGLITGGQPNFSGSAVDAPAASGQVTINVYPGSANSGVPVAVYTTAVSGGQFSFTPSAAPLADGTYTAQAQESDARGEVGVSSTVSFAISNAPPRITLSPPASEPVTNPAPTFTGAAETGPGASSSVGLIVYPGTTTNATPLEESTGTVGSGGAFQIQVEPGLANGQYTVVAAQPIAQGAAFSAPVTINVQAGPPALTITSPAAGAVITAGEVGFAGIAGTDYGDAATVKLSLYAGRFASGRPLATFSATVKGIGWAAAYPKGRLPIGTYTLRASQGNAVGAVTTVTRTFSVSLPEYVDMRSVSISRGRVTADVVCINGVASCSGDVLILTTRSFQTRYGGPRGPLRLMFSHFDLRDGARQQLTARITAVQQAALRHAAAAPLKVSLSYRRGTRLIVSTKLTGALAP
jgi:hypothetical protein